MYNVITMRWQALDSYIRLMQKEPDKYALRDKIIEKLVSEMDELKRILEILSQEIHCIRCNFCIKNDTFPESYARYVTNVRWKREYL